MRPVDCSLYTPELPSEPKCFDRTSRMNVYHSFSLYGGRLDTVYPDCGSSWFSSVHSRPVLYQTTEIATKIAMNATPTDAVPLLCF